MASITVDHDGRLDSPNRWHKVSIIIETGKI